MSDKVISFSASIQSYVSTICYTHKSFPKSDLWKNRYGWLFLDHCTSSKCQNHYCFLRGGSAGVIESSHHLFVFTWSLFFHVSTNSHTMCVIHLLIWPLGVSGGKDLSQWCFLIMENASVVQVSGWKSSGSQRCAQLSQPGRLLHNFSDGYQEKQHRGEWFSEPEMLFHSCLIDLYRSAFPSWLRAENTALCALKGILQDVFYSSIYYQLLWMCKKTMQFVFCLH